MEYHASEILRWFIGMILVFLLISVTIVGKQINDVNAFKNYVTHTIEREGGFNHAARKKIHLYSKQYYRGNFKVARASIKGQAPFGKTVDYVLQAKIALPFTNQRMFNLMTEGTATVMIRN